MKEVLAVKNSEDWFLFKLYESNQPEVDVFRILKTLKKYVRTDREIFFSIEFIEEKIIRKKPLNDLADDCLICVSLFSKHIRKLRRRKPMPTVKWYERLGAATFAKLGYYGIAEHYYFWEKFLRDKIFKEFNDLHSHKYLIDLG